jgi:hypothetical protein
MKFILSLLGLLLLVPAAQAKLGPSVSSKQVLGNGKFLLVMLYPPENTGNKDNPLNKAYPQSGLYPNDGSNQPLWTLDQPFEGQMFLSADGNFLANIVFPAVRKGDGIRFYHKGKLLRAYKVEELARADSIQDACPSCLWSGNVSFHDADEILKVESRDGRNWRFKLRTGKVVVADNPQNPLVDLVAQAGNENAAQKPQPVAPAPGFAAVVQDSGTSGGLAPGWIVGIIAALVLALSLGGFLLWRFGIAGTSDDN